jgi:hypothetical protein
MGYQDISPYFTEDNKLRLLAPELGTLQELVDAKTAPMSAERTFPPLTFCHVADAAFVCGCGTRYTASQQISSDQSFVGIIFAGTETALSPHGA